MLYNEENINTVSEFVLNNMSDDKLRSFTRQLLCGIMKASKVTFYWYVNEYTKYMYDEH